MTIEIVQAIRDYLREQGFTVGGDYSTLTVHFKDGSYLNIIVWYNPEAIVSLYPAGLSKIILNIPLAQPDSLEQIVKTLREYKQDHLPPESEPTVS